MRPALAEQPHRRQVQTLLVDFGGAGGKAAGNAAADVGPVAAVGEKGGELSLVEEWPHHLHVHQVGAAQVGIVDDDDIPGGRIRNAIDHRMHRVAHNVDEIGQATRSLDDDISGQPVIDTTGAIETVGDHR